MPTYFNIGHHYGCCVYHTSWFWIWHVHSFVAFSLCTLLLLCFLFYTLLLAPPFACFSFVLCIIVPFSYVAFSLSTFQCYISFYISAYTSSYILVICMLLCFNVKLVIASQCYIYFYVLILCLLLCFSVMHVNPLLCHSLATLIESQCWTNILFYFWVI